MLDGTVREVTPDLGDLEPVHAAQGLPGTLDAIADGVVVPNRIYTDYPTWALYETLLQPQERIYKQVNIMPSFFYLHNCRLIFFHHFLICIHPD